MTTATPVDSVWPTDSKKSFPTSKKTWQNVEHELHRHRLPDCSMPRYLKPWITVIGSCWICSPSILPSHLVQRSTCDSWINTICTNSVQPFLFLTAFSMHAPPHHGAVVRSHDILPVLLLDRRQTWVDKNIVWKMSISNTRRLSDYNTDQSNNYIILGTNSVNSSSQLYSKIY